MQRFFLNPENFKDTFVEIQDSDVVYQMLRVMRMRTGDRFIALDNSGKEFICELSNGDEKGLRGNILEIKENSTEPKLKLTLFQALPKKMELFEWVLQKGTEIGVNSFMPLITEHTERDEVSKPERLHKILKEAAEQSERGIIPELKEVVAFNKALEHEGKRVLLHSRGDFPTLSQLKKEWSDVAACSLFIGPEGGFSENEVLQAQKGGVVVASLGPRILRTETAGIAAASILLL